MTKPLKLICTKASEDYVEVYSRSVGGVTLHMELPSVSEEGKVDDDNLYIMLSKEDALKMAEELIALSLME